MKAKVKRNGKTKVSIWGMRRVCWLTPAKDLDTVRKWTVGFKHTRMLWLGCQGSSVKLQLVFVRSSRLHWVKVYLMPWNHSTMTLRGQTHTHTHCSLRKHQQSEICCKSVQNTADIFSLITLLLCFGRIFTSAKALMCLVVIACLRVSFFSACKLNSSKFWGKNLAKLWRGVQWDLVKNPIKSG